MTTSTPLAPTDDRGEGRNGSGDRPAREILVGVDGSEVGLNAVQNRLGVAMTNTQSYTARTRPQGTNNLFVAWETLTHANNPA